MDRKLIDPSRWKDRIDKQFEFSPTQLAAAVGLLVVFLAGLGLLYWQDARRPNVVRERVVDTTPPRQGAGAGDRPGARPILPKMVVHVAGAVGQPGVYRLTAGGRIVDAVNAAGGPTQDANLDAINLAAKIGDGQQILVPVRGQAMADPAAGVGQTATDGKVSLNNATVDQLDKLDGIGPVLAKRIVQYRESRGRFTKIEQLQNVEGIGVKKLALLKDKISLD